MSDDPEDDQPGDDGLSNVTPLRPDSEQPEPEDTGDLPPADVPPAPEDPGPERDCALLPLNDFGNGQRLVAHFGGDMLWVPRLGWHVWTGKVWAKDPDEIGLRHKAQQIGPLIELEIPHLRPSERDQALIDEERALVRERAELGRKGGEGAVERIGKIDGRLRELERELGAWRKRIGRHHTFAKDAGNSNRIKNMVGEASVHLSRHVDEMDAEALEVACETGVLRFSVTRDDDEGMAPVAEHALVPHSREQLITKMMPVEYDPHAQAPRFQAFLERVQPAAEMRRFLQRWFGLSMTAITGEQKLVFLHGAGANGKSVLVDLMGRILGDYSATAKVESLTGKNRRGGGDATPDLVPLIGARMVRASEPEEAERLQEGTVKELTGGEPILVRALHSDFVEVRPVGKITISGNHKPQIRGTDDGIWRRFLMVPWDVQIPKEERDPMLGERLWAERSGILNWLIEGLEDYLANGLQEPEAVLEATREFRSESDPVGAFLEAACVVTGEEADFLKSKEIVEAFQFWRMEQGESEWRNGTVSRAIKEKSRRWKSPTTGRGFAEVKRSIMGYSGIRFQDAFQRRFSGREAPGSGSGAGWSGDWG